MKKITEISGSAIKGRTFQHKLGVVTVFTGPNGSGKTARLSAIYLALAGGLPWMGGTNADIFTLASGPKMSATVVFDDGASFMSRTFTQEKGGSISSKVTRQGIADTFELPPVLLDPKKHYFDLSAPNRVKYVFARAKGAKTAPNLDGMFAEIKALESKRDGGAEFANGLAEDYADRYQNEVGRMGKAFDEWFSAIIKEVSDNKKDADAGAKRMRKTCEGLTAQAAGDLVPDESVVSTLEKELSAKTEEVGKLREQLRTAEAKAKQYNEKKATAGKLEDYRKDLFQAEADLANNTNMSAGYVSESETIYAQLEAVRKDIAAIETALAVARRDKENAAREMLADIDLEKERVEEAKASKAKAEAALVGHVSKVEEKTKATNEAKETLTRLQSQQADYEARMSEKLKAVEAINEELKCCPTCNRAAKGWKEEAKASFKREAEEFKSKAESLTGSIDEAERVWRGLDQERKAALLLDDIAEGNRSKIENATAYIDRMTPLFKRHEENAAKLAKATREIEDGTGKLATLKTNAEALGNTHMHAKRKDAEHAAYRDKVADAKSRIALLKQSIATAEAAQSELAEMGNIDSTDLQNQVEAAQREVAEMQQRHARFAEAKAREANRLKAVADAETKEMEAEIYKMVSDILTTRQGKIVEGVFAPILERATAICGGLIPAPLTYRDGDVGYWQASKGLFAVYEAFSDAEKLATRLGFAIALAIETPFKLLLIEQLSDVDSAKKAELLKRLVALVEDGTLDQVVLTDPVSSDYASPIPGVTVIPTTV